MSYDDHRIPAANLIGEAGRGLPQILGVLELGRINIALARVGVARAAFDASLAYAQQRETMGKPIAEHQAIQLKLADMATKLEAARLLTRNAAERRGGRPSAPTSRRGWPSSSPARPRSSCRWRRCASTAASGYTTELPIERYYRDAPLMVIGEGTNEIQRLVIARGLIARSESRA